MTVPVSIRLEGEQLKKWFVDLKCHELDDFVELRTPDKSTQITVKSHSFYLVSFYVKGTPKTTFEIKINQDSKNFIVGPEGAGHSSYYVYI